MTETKRVLFVCSGNYYRSRFAEILFNHLASENNLAWRADSRGILAAVSRNPYPLSPYTIAALTARGVPFGAPRDPMQLTDEDLRRADRIIALYDREHRTLFDEYFPANEKPVEYWDIPDVDEMSADRALARLEQRVRDLVRELAPQTL